MSVQLQSPGTSQCRIDPMSMAYNGEGKIFRMMRQTCWGPELLNLGYYPTFGGLGILFNGLRTLATAQWRLGHNSIALTGIQRDDHVLDVACGRGGSAFMLRHSTHAEVVHAIDLLEENIEIAKRIFPPDSRLIFQLGDAQKLPFEDEHFDKVLCCEAAFHFPDRGQFLKEAFRVLKPNGRLVVVDFVWRTPEHRECRNSDLGKVVRRVWGWDDMSSECEYRAMAARAGLKIVKILDWTKPVTTSIQQLSETVVWLQHRRWGQWILKRRYPMLASLTGDDWKQIRLEAAAHRFLHDHTFYKAIVCEKR